jgi:CelD/BcsL family acetyltransferase involved in cellulose biosynthesis
VFHYADIGHDAELSKFSPGTVLLYRLIEDLIAHDRPQTLNFGIGVSEYKRQFATEVREETSLLILRDTLRNRLRVGLHRSWRGLLARVKPLLRRPKLVLAGVLTHEAVYELVGTVVNTSLPVLAG